MIEYTISCYMNIEADYDSVTPGSCNPMFRIPVTCGYSAKRGYFVSKKAFLSMFAPSFGYQQMLNDGASFMQFYAPFWLAECKTAFFLCG